MAIGSMNANKTFTAETVLKYYITGAKCIK